MLIAAALCPAPPLLASELTGAESALPELAAACQAATAALLRAGPQLVAVVGGAERTGIFDPAGYLDLSCYAPALARQPGDGPARGTQPLPLSLGLGGRLLDEAGYAGRRELRAVSETAEPAECAAIGRVLAGLADRVGLLVMADGSARRSRRAPGYLDDRAAPFDAAVEDAVRAGDMAALLAVDPALARELMAAGRAAWQVLAGAMDDRRPASHIRYCDDPFGVAYLVASLTVSD